MALLARILHGSAKTTHAIRGELQRSQASVANLAQRYGINEKTVLKWRKRQSVEDLRLTVYGVPVHVLQRYGEVREEAGGRARPHARACASTR